ncbi:CcmD family protein [Paenibacillus athensensis]|uniref:CcmD family protein n=1 Tax=Paenibacillus athensensis TaxID=1967502 RepID=A0A4Y8Q270_9BACL|nr:CcmD family protein [Paenibacillus athensensis]MCD1261060.1 CcmD family protein [Paenibacillus athensensis]
MNYVFAAYSVVFILIFIYTALQSRRIGVLKQQVEQLAELEQDLRSQKQRA